MQAGIKMTMKIAHGVMMHNYIQRDVSALKKRLWKLAWFCLSVKAMRGVFIKWQLVYKGDYSVLLLFICFLRALQWFRIYLEWHLKILWYNTLWLYFILCIVTNQQQHWAMSHAFCLIGIGYLLVKFKKSN